jgi:phage-related protein
MYKVSFYTSKDKHSPIIEFLDECNDSLRAKILKQLKYIEEYGLTPAVPNLRKVANTRLWELRILGRDNTRIFCVNLPNREVKVLHIFKKKTKKTPLREINIAKSVILS